MTEIGSSPAAAPLGGGLFRETLLVLVDVEHNWAKGCSRSDGLSQVACSSGDLSDLLGHDAIGELDLGCVSWHQRDREDQLRWPVVVVVCGSTVVVVCQARPRCQLRSSRALEGVDMHQRIMQRYSAQNTLTP